MDRLRFRYCDDGARAVVNVLAWKPMGIAPGLSELGESAALRAIARDALDAWRLAAARTAAAVAGPSAGIGEDAAFDAAVCCDVAEAFAACFGDAGGFARHAEAALLAAEAIESGRAAGPRAFLDGLAAICKWGRAVESLLPGGEEADAKRWGDPVGSVAASEAERCGAEALAEALRSEAAAFDAPDPFSPFHGTFLEKVSPGPSVEVPKPIRSRLRDPRFLVLAGSDEGVVAVTLLGFEPMVLRSARPGVDAGGWAGAPCGGRLELAEAPLSRIGSAGRLPLPAGAAVSEGDELMLMGDGPALSGFSADFCRAAFSALADELAGVGGAAG